MNSGVGKTPLEEGMATHSSSLAWRIPWTEESGGLQSMGLQRVRHDWVTNTLTSHGSGLASWDGCLLLMPSPFFLV